MDEACLLHARQILGRTNPTEPLAHDAGHRVFCRARRVEPGNTVSTHMLAWNVREMTSICCSRVSRTKFTA